MAKDGGGEFFAGFIIGGFIGAALAILFAPQPGEQTLAKLREKGLELKKKLGEMSPEEAKEFIVKAVKEAIEEGKAAATRTKGEMLEKLDQLKSMAEEDTPPPEIELS